MNDASTLPAAPTVVLIHGLGRTRRAMGRLDRAARARGYAVLNYGYASRSADVPAHARALARVLATDVPSGVLYVVTHSLGGILLRQAVATGDLAAARVQRAVMLAPPNQGSEIAELFWHRPGIRLLGRAMLGPAGAMLGTGAAALVHQLPPVPFPTAVIAGTRSLNPLFSRFIDGPDDGKVSVARAAVSGMHAFLTVPHSHTFLMRAPVVIAQTLAFLERGAFDPPPRPLTPP